MTYTLEQLSADIRQALKADSGTAGKQAVCAAGVEGVAGRERSSRST